MAEGGMAAAMGNVYAEDNWMVHFRDTMRGGKYPQQLAHGRAARQGGARPRLRARAVGRAVRPHPDGKILQRDFGGHRYARLAHVGDRTGLELIRTLQQKVVSMGTDVFMECKVLQTRARRRRTRRRVRRLLAPDRRVRHLQRQGRHPRHRRRRQVLEVHVQLVGVAPATATPWPCGPAPKLIDMECIQFHPTGMVWPLSVRGLLVTEGVRGDGGVLRNSEGERFMFNYVPDMFRAETADTEEEGDSWYDDHSAGRRPPELLPRDEVARAINTEVKAGRGTPHGGVFLDIAAARSAEFIRRRLPSMYHQFMELAGVDITREPMEIGPTCHYIMGGVKVDADTAATRVPGLFAAGEVAGGMHGANRLGGNSLSDLVVFGRRAGIGAAEYIEAGDVATRVRRWPRSKEPSPRRSRPSTAPRARTPTTSSTTSRR